MGKFASPRGAPFGTHGDPLCAPTEAAAAEDERQPKVRLVQSRDGRERPGTSPTGVLCH